MVTSDVIPWRWIIILQRTCYYCRVFRKWQEQYGDVFTVKIGTRDVYIVNGYKMVSRGLREKAESFNARPYLRTMDVTLAGQGKSTTRLDL